MNIDKEWESFMSHDLSCEDNDDEHINELIEDEYDEFISSNISNDLFNEELHEAPKASNIYISTKTKIAYLNRHMDLKELFWLIKVIPYAQPVNGVIKKQMKFNSLTKEELNLINDKVINECYFEEHIITHIDNPSGRIKFKDIRKISIGISKKDIMSYRCKKKSAFYNCFVLIIRMKIEQTFKEFHVKVFNTGKLEIPGVQSDTVFELILKQVIEILQPYVNTELAYKENSNETVLINSNFNCGFFINRETLYDILMMKYNLQCIYDPCSYPGIQCKFYYNPDIGIQSGSQISEENKHLYKNISQVSFMIFRTGSVLIVGKCDENVLIIIYEFLKVILTNEFKSICQRNVNKSNTNNEGVISKDKKKKVRRKTIITNI
jgi:TATA-box binding protein (TBP) (component of TFIID and TFIIIB)